MVAAAALRQRRYLARQREGLIVLDVVAPEIDVAEMLLAEAFLTSDEPSRDELSDALSRWRYREVTRHANGHWPEV
jgi:hypothetical protein